MIWQSRHTISVRILLVASFLLVGSACIAHGAERHDSDGVQNAALSGLESGDRGAPATLGATELLILCTTGSVAIFSLGASVRCKRRADRSIGNMPLSISADDSQDSVRGQLTALYRELHQLEVAMIEATKWPIVDNLRVHKLEERKRAVKRSIGRLRSRLVPDLIA